MYNLIAALQAERDKRKADCNGIGEPVIRVDGRVGVCPSDKSCWMSIADLIKTVKEVLGEGA